jgi:signal transduction histidine kinase
MAETAKKRKAVLIAAMVGVITVFLYLSELKEHTHHLFYQGLYFIPVMLAGFWLGLKGGLMTSATITLLQLPFTFIYWGGFTIGDANNLMELILYNAVAALLGILRDREQAHDVQLKESERLAAMGKACSALAHDMRTPLIAIGGLCRSAQRHVNPNDEFAKKLSIIVEESQRLDKMVSDMLDFSRPLELYLASEDIRDLVSQCLDVVSETAGRRRVKIHEESSANLPPALVDRERMKQALLNLLINAIEASPEGETVTVACERQRRRILIDVRDHGDGIPPDQREEIFFPFFTTKKGGTGLGLPIVKKIIEAHRGNLEILDNPDRGVTFRMAIPLGSV